MAPGNKPSAGKNLLPREVASLDGVVKKFHSDVSASAGILPAMSASRERQTENAAQSADKIPTALLSLTPIFNRRVEYSSESLSENLIIEMLLGQGHIMLAKFQPTRVVRNPFNPLF